VFPDFSLEIFNQVCRINDFTDLQGTVEKNSKLVPVCPPTYDGITVFTIPFIIQGIEGMVSTSPVGDSVNVLHIFSEVFRSFQTTYLQVFMT
jgi:hypothetical protein